MKKRTSRLPILLSGFIFIICLYFVIKLYKSIEAEPNYSGNPVFDGWYADPEVALFGSTYWIFPTYSAAFSEQVFLDAFSSEDLVHWKKHEKIIDTTAVQWAEKAIWAPCVVEKDGTFYLFFSANDLQTPESKWWDPLVHEVGMAGGIGIGIADKPGGPYKDYLGKPLIGEVVNGAQPIDQFIYEEAGQYYIIYGGWGHCNIGILADGFSGLKPFENGEILKEITPPGYVEGPVMFKRSGIYYLMWSEGDWSNETYCVAYGISDELTGPYKKKGIVVQQDTSVATGAGHHSVLNIPGSDDWYIVYHRRPIPNEGRDHRVTCIERMYFNEAGEIKPVKITFEGVEARLIQPKH